jgi:hypothetical protein
MATTMLSQEFKSHDKLQAIALAERNSINNNPRKSITVQHFSDSGQPDSPAEIVLCQAGHSPVAIKSLNGGYYVATENDTENVTQGGQGGSQPGNQQGSGWQQNR